MVKFFLLTLAFVCADGENHVEHVRQLNRTGQWHEAIDVATEAVRDESLSTVTRCELILSLSYAQLRLNDSDAAAETLARIDELTKHLPDNHYIHIAVERRRKELKEVQAPKRKSTKIASKDLSGIFWSMRQANFTKDFDKAIHLAGQLTSAGQLMNEQRCEVAMHQFFALHQSGDHAKAQKILSQFDAMSLELPLTSPVRLQMHLLRQSLGLPINPDSQVQLDRHEPQPDGFWKTIDPEQAGLLAEPLNKHSELCRKSGADAFMVVVGSRIVVEEYALTYQEPMYTMSSVKSITALLVGMLVNDGMIEDVRDPVSRYLPSWDHGAKAEVRIEHLLRMTSGLSRISGQQSVAFKRDKTEFVLGLEPTEPPGTVWAYSNEGVQLLSPIMEKVSGQPLHQFAQTHLFEPLGMTRTRMRTGTNDETITYADAETTLRDFARLGVLILQDGRWADRQIVPADWIRQCVTPGRINSAYGYLFWINDEPLCYSMQGYLNTSLFIFPEHDLIIARMQSRPYLHVTEDYDLNKVFDLVTMMTDTHQGTE